jgi:hypothetical protein
LHATSDLLRRWGDGLVVTIDELGGPTALLDRSELAETHLLRTVQAVCDLWDDLAGRRDDAIRVLLQAADTEELGSVGDVHKELLTNPDVIAAIHQDLEKVVRRRATDAVGIVADIAVETWTRLALAGWCKSSLAVCGRLAEMAAEARAAGDTTSYLVRAVGAALHRWGYHDIEVAMTDLRTIEEYDSDAAFELALHQLGIACVASDGDVSLDHLRQAIVLLEDAESWEGRIDASAYLGPLRGLLRFVDGDTISSDEVISCRTVVSRYLLGYRGLARHWRQGRADLTGGWSMLLGLLAQAAEGSERTWFDPSSIIEGAAGLLIADTTLTLAAPVPGIDNRGIVALVKPRIAESFVAQEPSADFIDRWLDAATTAAQPDSAMITAVVALKELIHQAGAYPKADRGARDGIWGYAEPERDEFLRFYWAGKHHLTLTEEKTARRIVESIRIVVPEAMDDAVIEVVGVVSSLVRFVSYHLALRQSGSRSADWLVGGRDNEGHFPGEHRLSDALRQWFAPTADVVIEAADTGGGFADVAIRYQRFTFYIEVKRVDKHRRDEQLIEEYGDQATQYAVSDIPVVFLAVLDYTERVTRIDLDGTMWTVRHRHPGATRDYSLTGLRVQANTASPSTTSTMSGKARRALKAVTPKFNGEDSGA